MLSHLLVDSLLPVVLIAGVLHVTTQAIACILILVHEEELVVDVAQVAYIIQLQLLLQIHLQLII